MSQSTKNLDFSELTEVLPEKPTSWKCKQMKTFLKFVNLEDLNEKFAENTITGKLFLELEPNNLLWEDLDFNKKTEKTLQEYQKLLLEYEKTFSGPKKSSKELDKVKEVKNTLEKALNKKEVKIENPNYIVEEEKNSKKTMNSKKIEKSTVHDSDNLEKREYNPSDALPKKEKHMKKELSPSAPLNKNNSKRPLSVSDSDEEEEAVVETKLVDRSQPIKKDEKLEKSKQKKSSYENENTSKKQMEKDQEKPKAKKNVDSNKVQEKTFEKIKPKNPKEEKSEEDEHNPTIQLDRSKKNTISKENVDDTEKFDKKKGKNKHKITQPNKSDSSDSDYYLNKNPTLAIDRNKKKAQPPIKNDDSKDSSDGKYKKPTLKNDDVKKPENPTLAIDRNKKNGQPQNTNDDSDDDVDEKNKEPTVQRNDLKKYEEKKIEEKLDNDFPAKTKKQDSRAEKQKELSDVQHLTIGKSKQFSMQGKKEEKYDPEMTNIKKEKLKEDSDEDENEKYGTITSRPETTNAVEKTEINLRVINQHSQISSTTFPCDFTIYRDPKLFNNIFLEDPDHAISRKHAQVILLKDKGFFLQDRGSSNHTFLRIHHFTRVTLDEGIELLFGNSLFKILSIKEGMVTMESTPNYILNCSETKKIKFKIKARLFFGRDPIKGENSNDTFSVFNDDQSIEKTHVIFHYSAGKVQLEPKKTTFGAWIKLGNRNETSDFYMLVNDSEIRLGNYKLLINQTFTREEFPICELCCNDFANSVFEPCHHSTICYQCARQKKTCQKNCGSTEFKKLINLYR